MKYINSSNGKVAELIEVNEKTGTVTLEYVDTKKPTGISPSTFKRWWKKVEEDEVQEQKELVPMPGADKLAELKEEVCGDGTPLAEVGKEIAAQAKEKAKAAKPKKEKKPKTPAFESKDLRTYISKHVAKMKNTASVDRHRKDGSDMNKTAFKVGGHMFATMTFSRTNVTINVKSGVSVKGLNPSKTAQSFFGSKYIFTEDTDKVRELIAALLDAAYADRVNTTETKAKKKEAK